MESNENNNAQIIPIDIEHEMSSNFLDYSMSVIVARALPDARDGLKPVHRRILYGINMLGIHHNKPYKKSATVVGEVIGNYHPHGDASIYDASVRMAQDWSLRYPLIDGQGNFGSVDGDAAAAFRYTEMRFKAMAEDMLADIGKNTVDFQPTYDNSKEEPTVLPTKFPNLLVNGASGIAVGMATNMPAHNLGEVIDATIACIDDPEIVLTALMQHIKAPDFPTGGIIYGYEGVKKAYETGKGRVVIRGRAIIESNNNKQQIIITELPYMVNKAKMIADTAALVNDKKILGISALRDESDREGMRVVYDLKCDAVGSVVLNNLYKHTALQSSFSINNLALVKGRPELLNLKELIQCFINHRHDVVTRRTAYELRQAQQRLHLLEGYMKVLDNLAPIIKLIKAAADSAKAQAELIATYQMSEVQAKAILELRLQRLTGMERAKIVADYERTVELVEELEAILADRSKRIDIIKDELLAIKEKYADPRRTEIVYAGGELAIEDMIPNAPMVLTISAQGYIKRTLLSAYKTQNRGGVGAKGVSTKKEDFTTDLFIATAHEYLLIFTASGQVFWKRVYEIPEGSKTSQGRAIQNLLDISAEDSIKSVLKVKDIRDEDYLQGKYVIFCTARGIVKKTPLASFSNPRVKGIKAITFKEGDSLLEVKLTEGENDIILALRSGKAIRFPEQEIRAVGRTAAGVRGITLAGEDDRVIGMVSTIPDEGNTLLVVSEKGYGKRSYLAGYRITRRGGKGIKTLQITEKTGALIAIKAVVDGDELMVINASGTTLRTEVVDLRIISRATLGVCLVRLRTGDTIASVAKVSNKVIHMIPAPAEDTPKE